MSTAQSKAFDRTEKSLQSLNSNRGWNCDSLGWHLPVAICWSPHLLMAIDFVRSKLQFQQTHRKNTAFFAKADLSS